MWIISNIHSKTQQIDDVSQAGAAVTVSIKIFLAELVSVYLCKNK